MSYSRRLIGLFAGATSCLAIGVADTAAAQPVIQQQPTEEQDRPQLNAIIVTAERREESLQDTPISVVALSADEIQEIGAQDLQDLGNFVPNVSIGSSALGPVMPGFSIRGIGQSSTRVHQEAGVALYVDDLYYPRTVGSLFQVVDLERIEVLRGPQGTLFGRNAVGGAIRYVTQKPVDEFEGRVSATVGSFNRFDVQGMINVPIMPGVAIRVQGARLTSDGYIDQVRWDRRTNTLVPTDVTLGSRDDTILRGALRVEPTADLTIDLSASHSSMNGNAPAQLVRSIGPAFGPGANAQRAFLPIQRYLTDVLSFPPLQEDDPLIVSPGEYIDVDRCITDDPSIPVTSLPTYDLNRLCDPEYDIVSNIYNATVNFDLSGAITVKSITGYQTLDAESTLDLWGLDQPSGQDEQGQTLSQELQLLYAEGPLDFTLGLFYYRQRAREQTYQRRLSIPFSPLSPNIVEISGEDTRFNQLAQARAAYGEGTLNVFDGFYLTGGLRYTEDEKTTTLQDTRIAGNEPFSNSLEFNSLDYRLVARYEFTPEVSVYGSVSSGYKAGGFNFRLVAFEPFNPPPNPPRPNPQPVVMYSPETITNHEIGFRSELLDRRVRFNMTGYYMIYENIIQDFIDFSGPAGAQVFSVNAADADIKGVEADVTVAASDALTLTGSIALNDVEFTRIAIGSPALDPSTCPGVRPANPTECEPMEYARAPELSFTVGAQYVTPMFNAGDLVLSANYGYTGEQQSQYSAASSILLDDYGLMSLRAEFNHDNGWTIAAFVTNLFDEFYASGGGFGATNNGNVVIDVPGRPREFGAQATIRF